MISAKEAKVQSVKNLESVVSEPLAKYMADVETSMAAAIDKGELYCIVTFTPKSESETKAIEVLQQKLFQAGFNAYVNNSRYSTSTHYYHTPFYQDSPKHHSDAWVELTIDWNSPFDSTVGFGTFTVPADSNSGTLTIV